MFFTLKNLQDTYCANEEFSDSIHRCVKVASKETGLKFSSVNHDPDSVQCQGDTWPHRPQVDSVILSFWNRFNRLILFSEFNRLEV